MGHSQPRDSAGTVAADHAGYAAATKHAGVAELGDRMVVRVTGDDRADFLHGMCSADIKGAPPGSVVPALFLTEHAHVIAEFFAWVGTDAILIETGRAQWTRARQHLERLLVADDVEFDEADALIVIDVEGPEAPAAIRPLLGEAAASLREWGYVTAADGAIVGSFPRLGAPAYSILAPRAQAADLQARMVAAVTGARRIDSAVLDIIRVEHGIAAVGIDTSEKTLALEARMERAISPSKGCYVGQETIERATARGGLRKRLQGLRFRGNSVIAPGAALTLSGKDAGRVTSTVISPRLGPIGLGIVHESAWRPGSILDVAGGGTAEVSDLPFS